ncbi:hypothetical protein JR316_0005347 [Psilocybe cubensis]|uniref:Uncharacterized protein n=1 Tax=Psilocybe cubensis TaxID=181762 RepID=A0ACB8H5G4_PSICU|nr:hypothetical protein JR316_0005347 [Psilocybe cubensis]KAH9483243.1 hypothetical protein JR316_0005347 [Psilocybe cubensis]
MIQAVDEETQLRAFVLDPASLATAASLAAQVWETVIWFPDEVEHLWRSGHNTESSRAL